MPGDPRPFVRLAVDTPDKAPQLIHSSSHTNELAALHCKKSMSCICVRLCSVVRSLHSRVRCIAILSLADCRTETQQAELEKVVQRLAELKAELITGQAGLDTYDQVRNNWSRYKDLTTDQCIYNCFLIQITKASLPTKQALLPDRAAFLEGSQNEFWQPREMRIFVQNDR